MGRSAKLFLAPWCLWVMLVSVVSFEFTRTICHVDICTSEEFCDHENWQCRSCDNTRGDCLKDSLPGKINFTEDCPAPAQLVHGSFKYLARYRPGTNVTFTCDEGYKLVGDDTSTCEDFGTWSSPEPECEESNILWHVAIFILAVVVVILLVFIVYNRRNHKEPQDNPRRSGLEGEDMNYGIPESGVTTEGHQPEVERQEADERRPLLSA
ncbi:scavenger receptor cysteine-rich domain superfamily protein-like isoform X1 [Mya arenaria]|uniref:scavenger receptor cysteine-rich domain superfamily protein-like isoform X1 n=1 Tax=Mya arenaria TaxID=6604 RepID=UPI0022E14DA3|nr:scavenger receptor cysteine-rich domain superfamily protein-like isoform X1 [Mya arenaria]